MSRAAVRVEPVTPKSWLTSEEASALDLRSPRSGRVMAIDAAVCATAAVLGALFLSPELRDDVIPVSQVVVDITLGALACLSLWWRRRRPLGIAVACALLGMFSISATAAGLLALFSLAVHLPVRAALIAVAVWIPASAIFALYSPTTDPVSVVLVTAPLALAATAWGMFVRARRQLLLSLRERAARAEADQRLHEDRARMAERTRIAREMHDVLAHRISLLALHAGALEVRPNLPAAEVRQTAELLRTTARQALEELREVIGVLRKDQELELEQRVPQPSLPNIRGLVEETRRAGTAVDFDLRVKQADAISNGAGRDAYRVVQEALTNIRKHAGGAAARVLVTGAPDSGLHVSVRNRQLVTADSRPTLPGSGAGLIGLQERVALAGGTLTHGPDGSGDFVVDARLKW
jgi:signal transduction histidine kinase